MSNLVTMALQSLAPQLVSRLAGPLGISPALVEQGMGMIIPTLFGGALRRSETTAGAEGLAAAIGRLDPNHLSNLTSGATPIDPIGEAHATAGDSAVSNLLGGGASEGIMGTLSSLLGVKSDVVSTLAGVAAPLVIGTIGKTVGPNPGPGAVQALLAEQRGNIAAALPVGIGSMLGLTSGEPAPSVDPDPVPVAAPGRNWWPWLIGAVILLALIYALTQCSSEPAPTPVTPAPEPVATQTAGETLDLPGGTSITVPPGSIGYQLATFLASSDPAPKSFVFDNLTFSTASDALTPESSATVETIASILKAYPNTAATIVGYTDNQGDPAANRTLSENRAKMVSQALATAGVAAARLQTRGLGEGSPIADNATEEGRAQNRRTELTITRK